MVVPNSFLKDSLAHEAVRKGIARAHRYISQNISAAYVNASNVRLTVSSNQERRLDELDGMYDADNAAPYGKHIDWQYSSANSAETDGFLGSREERRLFDADADSDQVGWRQQPAYREDSVEADQHVTETIDRSLYVTMDFSGRAQISYTIIVKGGNVELQAAIIKSANDVDLMTLNKEVRVAVAAAKGQDYTVSISSKAEIFVEQASPTTVAPPPTPAPSLGRRYENGYTTTTTMLANRHMYWGIRFFNRTGGIASGAEGSSTFVGVLFVFVFSACRSIH